MKTSCSTKSRTIAGKIRKRTSIDPGVPFGRNKYIGDLKEQNTRFAEALTVQKQRNAQLVQRVVEMSADLHEQSSAAMSYKAVLMRTQQHVKKAFNFYFKHLDSLLLIVDDLQIIGGEPAQELSTLHQLATALAETHQEQLKQDLVLQPPQGARQNPELQTHHQASQQRDCGAAVEDAVCGSPPRHAAARPMVRGHTISKPTISLQRVNVPCPIRGVSTANTLPVISENDSTEMDVSVNVQSEEVSVQIGTGTSFSSGNHGDSVAEQTLREIPLLPESDETRENLMGTTADDSALQPYAGVVRCSGSSVHDEHFGSDAIRPHVVLERLQLKSADPITLGDVQSPADMTEKDVTGVNFGSFSYSLDHDEHFGSDARRPRVVLERLQIKSADPITLGDIQSPADMTEKDITGVNFGSFSYSEGPKLQENLRCRESRLSCSEVVDPNVSNPWLSMSDSSSDEDEDLALRIVESKRSYLERSRQLDLQEGTSWNYDEKGNYQSRPSKRKKLKSYKTYSTYLPNSVELSSKFKSSRTPSISSPPPQIDVEPEDTFHVSHNSTVSVCQDMELTEPATCAIVEINPKSQRHEETPQRDSLPSTQSPQLQVNVTRLSDGHVPRCSPGRVMHITHRGSRTKSSSSSKYKANEDECLSAASSPKGRSDKENDEPISMSTKGSVNLEAGDSAVFGRRGISRPTRKEKSKPPSAIQSSFVVLERLSDVPRSPRRSMIKKSPLHSSRKSRRSLSPHPSPHNYSNALLSNVHEYYNGPGEDEDRDEEQPMKRTIKKRPRLSKVKRGTKRSKGIPDPENNTPSSSVPLSFANLSARDSGSLSASSIDPGSRPSSPGSESSASETSCRPRRNKAPYNLKEPSLVKKLRRT